MPSWHYFLKRHWFILALTIGTFLPGIIYEPTRWNIITEAWGAFIAGIILWIFLEWKSDDFQTEVWLRKSAKHLNPIVSTILNSSGLVATLSLGLPDELQLDLRTGPTRELRRQAALKAYDFVKDMSEEGNETVRYRATKAYLLADDIKLQLNHGVNEIISENIAFLSRLTELHGAIQQFNVKCRIFLGAGAIHEQPQSEIGFQTSKISLAELGHTAITLCETCSDILEKAGILPSH